MALGSARARAIAFYLPQFHPIPENDEWWGAGFTEWRNVARARPLFPRHNQPHLPGALGFYDLRVPETRQAQADLARTHGVEAFCYWHYWFGGRRLLERPISDVLTSGEPDMSFCLGWANQTWTGVWHGAPEKILVEQTYPGPEDDRAHFQHVLPIFNDARYFAVEGRPLFYIFRPEQLPDPRAFVDRWQAMARAEGLPGLYLVAEISDLLGDGPKAPPPHEWGFDAGVYVRLPAHRSRAAVLRMRAQRKLLRWPEMYRYHDDLATPPPAWARDDVYPCVYPNWDNTPRAGQRGLVITDSSPRQFGSHVRSAIERLQVNPPERRLLFIKSWNEWAEGNYLEPDLEHGTAYLDVLRRELFASDG